MGRPLKEIDERQVRELASIQCTMEEIAAVCGCHIDTLRDRFSNIIKDAREEGKASLRRMQYLKAKEGNATMLIWLGKQLLDQRDKQEVHAEVRTGDINIDDVS